MYTVDIDNGNYTPYVMAGNVTVQGPTFLTFAVAEAWAIGWLNSLA